MNEKIAVVIGAGPAGLTAAYELLEKTDIKPIVIELSGHIGGLSKTVNYRGNRIDIGGHRFFSKSERVLKWWLNILPLQGALSLDSGSVDLAYHGKKQAIELPEEGPDPKTSDKVMLLRRRRSRILFLRKFFPYPLSVSLSTLMKLGLRRTIKIGITYIGARLFPIKPETSLRDFMINRFGKELYLTFFRSYTEKVWGVPCHRITAEWGAQRIKGLSLTKALLNQVRSLVSKDPTYLQKKVETSLIERFMYPKFGPGQMWEEVARLVRERGGEIHLKHKLSRIITENGAVVRIEATNVETGDVREFDAGYAFSTMPVKELITSLGNQVPDDIVDAAESLEYRDMIVVGVLLEKDHLLKKSDDAGSGQLPDNWIYIQERDVKVGRIQIFNNWSPYMVKDSDTIWLGMEYFCAVGDSLWSLKDEELRDLATRELNKLGFIQHDHGLDYTVVREKKAYPAYYGGYSKFDLLREFTDKIRNLFLIGRNGMHRYNNQDHSMLTAMTAVENIVNGIESKDNIWAVNTEEDYHEQVQEKAAKK